MDKPFVTAGRFVINTENINYVTLVRDSVEVVFNNAAIAPLLLGPSDAAALLAALRPITRNVAT